MESQYLWVPTVIQNGQHLDIYSSMLADGTIFVNTPIDQRIAGLVASCLVHISSNSRISHPPKIYLNTKLGDITAAMSVVDMLEFYKSQDTKIQTMGIGEIGIAAALVLAAGTKGSRKIATHALLSLRLGLENLVFGGELSAQAKANQGETLRDKAIELFVRYCGKDKDEFRSLTNSERYLDADQTKDLGLVDEIV